MTGLERVRRALWSAAALREDIDAHLKEDAERDIGFHVAYEALEAELTELREAVRAVVEAPPQSYDWYQNRLRQLIEE